MLENYEWPGNIRELKSCLTRLLITCETGSVGAEDVRRILSIPLAEFNEIPHEDTLSGQERKIILAAYERHRGNISAVVRDLGISRNKVYKKLKETRSFNSAHEPGSFNRF